MDEFVVKTLQKWNLGDLVERFRDEEVNEEAFSVLTPDIVKELIPKLGKRAIFNARYAEFKQSLLEQSSTAAPQQQSSDCSTEQQKPPVTLAVDHHLTPPALYPMPSAYANVHPKEQHQTSAQNFESYFLQQLRPQGEDDSGKPATVPVPVPVPMDEPFDDEPSLKRIKLEIYEGEELSKDVHDDDDQDGFEEMESFTAEDSIVGNSWNEGVERLRTLLSQSPLTRGLLEVDCLDKSQRIMLTNTVVQYLISSSKNGRVTSKTFRFWRDAILSLWPTQAMANYFRKGNGRLNDRYQYINRAKKDEMNRVREQHEFASAMDQVAAIAAGEGAGFSQKSEDSWDGENSSGAAGEDDGGDDDKGRQVEEETVTELRTVISNCFVLKDTLKAGFLTPNQRNTLSSAIVEHLMNKNGGPISIDEMVTYAQAIEQLYPNENASIYLRRACNRSRVNGKLFDRYSYVKRKNSLARGKAWDDFLDERTTYGQLREIKDLDQARKLWTETLKVRREMTRKFSPAKILDSFPFLKQPEGYQLLLEDFERECPDVKNIFQENWPQTATSICKHVIDTNLLVGVTEFNVDDFQTDIVTSCLIVLPLLFKLSKRNEKKWMPSRLDVCHNFVLYARDFREAVDALKRRKQQLEHYKRRINPVVVAIGPTISTIEMAYVVVQDTFYRFESLPEAMELCLKICAALGVHYLEEVSAPWYFVQRFVMKLELQSDFINSRVFTVVEALNLPMR